MGDGDTATLQQSEFTRLVGGTLAVEGIIATIKGFTPRASGVVLCTFEVLGKCAGVTLYRTPNGQAQAHLREDPNAPRLWIELQESIPVLQTGLPALYGIEVKLPRLAHSMTLSFATRLEVLFEGQQYRGPISTPCPAPYLHPAPDKPETCFAVHQLWTDYYGRSTMRMKAYRCPPFDSKLRVTMAPGSDLPADEFMARRVSGLFGAQALFEREYLFEAFGDLATLPDGSGYSVGIAHVRVSDNREGEPTVESFSARRID